MLRRGSVYSIGSLIITPKIEYYEDLTDVELQQELCKIVESNLLLKLENDVYERYLSHRDPDGLQAIAQILQTTKRVQRITTPQNLALSVTSLIGSTLALRDIDSRMYIRNAYYTPSLIMDRAPKRVTKITYAQRIEMVNTEIRELQEEIVKLGQRLRRKKIHLRARMQESEISIYETLKTKEAFEEQVVRKGVDPITGKIPAEKFIRFIEEWLKLGDIIMERIRLNVITLKTQMQKVKLQLKHGNKLSNSLRVIDFEELKIENEECIRKIDEKNQYLLGMKRIAGHYSIALTKHKGKLSNLMSNMNEITNKIVSKDQEITKLKLSQSVMKDEIKKMEKQIESITELMENFRVPAIIEFVKMRAELHELHRIHRHLSRERELQKIMLRLNRQNYKNIIKQTADNISS
ncbi:hypothetical protein HN011_011210 [Eciton burchellii]|nr:hypothetical protein HN011_011210 [Eciton burchellii]